MVQHRPIKVIKSHVVADNRFKPRRVIMINAGSMVELTEALNEYMERNPLTGTIYSTGHIHGENEYYALVRNTFDEPTVEKPFECPLNTDQLKLGQYDVYFKAYPGIKWCVDHIDGDYAYLGLYNVSEKVRFNYIDSVSYAGSTIALKCAEYLSDVIPNIAQYLEDVTVEGVTAKVFIPTFYQFSGQTGFGDTSGPVFSFPSASANNRRACYAALANNYMWLSTASNFRNVWLVDGYGGLDGNNPSCTYGFRPEVKVRFKKSS